MGTSTARVRALRERCRKGMSLFKIRLTGPQIEALVSKGYLSGRDRNDVTAIGAAAEAWLVDAKRTERGGMTIPVAAEQLENRKVIVVAQDGLPVDQT